MINRKPNGWIVKSETGKYEVYTSALSKKFSMGLMEEETLTTWAELETLGYRCVPYLIQEI